MTLVTGYTNGSYRIRRGLYPADELTATYEIKRWPRQSDQGYRKWLPVPLNESGLYSGYQELVTSLGGLGVGEGDASFTWRLSGLTTGMVKYVTDTVFGGNQTDQFTTMTWDRWAGWRVGHVVGRLGPPPQVSQLGYRRGLIYLDLRFVVTEDAPAT